MRKLLFPFTCLVLLMRCAILPQKNNFNTSKGNSQLLAIGEKSVSIYKSNFETFGLPRIAKKVNISIHQKPFTKNTYKSYLKSISETGKLNLVNYVDSIPQKPKYIQITLKDKVEIVESLKTKNKDILTYLENTPESKIITSIRVLPTTQLLELMKKSENTYLKVTPDKNVVITFYNKRKEMGYISLSALEVFQYELSSFCWSVNGRNKLELVTIISANETCLESNSTDVSKLKKEINDNRIKF